ncbi:MAG: hypothetical protein ABW141_01690 [Candidatus Thiodiazotropha endolucinida]
MYQEAKGRIRDADILSGNINRSSDSDALLRILGFEILLKCVLLICRQTPKNNHNYSKLWLGLPVYVQKEILDSAKSRAAGHADYSDLPKLLNSFQYVFENARYFYEVYKGFTLDQQKQFGVYWEELGSPTEIADVTYYPMELLGLIDGLSKYIESNLSNKRVN